MAALRLEIAENQGDRWLWRLKDADGAYLADHQVVLDHGDPKVTALFDLPGYLRHYAAPDKRDEDERRHLAEIGEWMGREILGEDIGRRIVAASAPPIVVRVQVPPDAEKVLFFPLDIAHVDGRPLALHGARLVFEALGDDPPPAGAIGERLRLLALFSLPPAGSPLNLRRERQMLRSLVRRLTGAQGVAVELRILQYGVTRDSLRDALVEGDGWDVIHFSGHGQSGTLVLEKPDGSPDPISAKEVGQLLRLTGQRLKLATLSACLSAAPTIQQTLSLLMPARAPERRDEALAQGEPVADGGDAPTVARALSNSLDCAVLAMRYAVEDEFAMFLAKAVYEGLFFKNQALPQALQLALDKLAGDGGGAAAARAPNALAIATPALFGARATALKLAPPRGRPELPSYSLAYFPDEPAHFVGRVSAMTRASATLAIENEKSSVLFYGMAGAGKSACAIELAYHLAAAQRFQAFVWYSAPKAGSDIAGALRDFAVEMEKQLPGFEMVHVIDQEARLKAWLPKFVELLENFAVLIVLDNVETLLTDNGQWRDDRWASLIEAIQKAGLLSRTVLTSRIRPARLNAAEIISVHALSLGEAVLLTRELPALRKLLDGTAADRDLVRRTLRLVQGHPKLIHFAEGLASDPARLAAQLDRAEKAQSSQELETFLEKGESSFDSTEFTRSLFDWTHGIAGALPEGPRLCFSFLCLVEEDDRDLQLLDGIWPAIWSLLERPDPPPNLFEACEALAQTGLVDKQAQGDDEAAVRIVIHPGVAEAARAESEAKFRRWVDEVMAEAWTTVLGMAVENYTKDTQAGPIIIRAGMAAFPYLGRLQEWEVAAATLESVTLIDHSPSTMAAVLPRLRQLAEALADTPTALKVRVTLAKVLALNGQTAEAEAMLREVARQAEEAEDYWAANGAIGELVNLLWNQGKPEEAIKLLREKKKYNELCNLGPWSMLGAELWELQLTQQLGTNVLERVQELCATLDELPDPPTQPESHTPWNVRETLLDLGHTAAMGVQQWALALEFSAKVQALKQKRNAPIFELAKARFNDYGPLISLERFDEVRDLLAFCRAVAEEFNDVGMQAKIQSGYASLERAMGRPAVARKFEEVSLRLEYVIGNPEGILISHYNIAAFAALAGGAMEDIVAHRIAAIMLAVLSQDGRSRAYLAALARDLRAAREAQVDVVPGDFDRLCAIVEKVEGARFREKVDQLGEGRVNGDDLLRQIVEAASPE